ncbi:hypothetical protein N656DRAFT_781751 [Canariomyces notabilis]|uniref:Uncharacterized protein n=1 Tax=Canariomyces notabilis TaxID=2074819 RepID=A0AAN6QN12_9PEZI|nr:hypothetical protein N656DRAFT_781751 [Canariomyces arenarius]
MALSEHSSGRSWRTQTRASFALVSCLCIGFFFPLFLPVILSLPLPFHFPPEVSLLLSPLIGFLIILYIQRLTLTDRALLYFVDWKSREAAQTYCASDSGLAVVAGEAKNETAVFELLPAAGQLSLRGVDGVFEAPCTEVFTAFGAEEGFIDNVSRFVDGLEKVGTVPIEGYLGAVFGEDVGTEGKEVGEKVVRMLIGW